MEEKLHSGHRDRLRKKFLQYGADGLEFHELMELLLFYSIPRKDTNEIAHRLLERFPTLGRLMSAEYDELCDIKGISENSAVLIRLFSELAHRYYKELAAEETDGKLETLAQQAIYLRPYFLGAKVEQMYLLCLDHQWRPVYCDRISEGGVSAVKVDCRKLAETALKYRAARVIVAHNHPDGFAMFSSADVQTTNYIRNALGVLDIPLYDHLLFAGVEFVSFRQQGYIDL